MSEALLEAGAILPGGPRGTELDAVTARSYRHPVLGDRTVVRLVGATIGPAEDLTMEFLGFAPGGEPVAVGHARRQALGFPAWALVHDPANGRHALALVKEMEKLARVARAKPGNAKDGYDALAGRLGAAAPQFLPTFWEQAGRAFTAADNPRMAGSCFTEARRAEQVHGLTVDEDRVRDVHLEFAFAGALTAAMLAEYSRGVIARRPPEQAYELVRTLALRRVAGGLPPHTSMAADLAKLARAAGLDPEREADEVVARLLTYPAMMRAHPSAWKSYRKSLVRLGKRDAAVRERLLQIVPQPPGYRTDMTEQWLELLEASGAAADLTAPAGASSPPGAATRWLARFLQDMRSGRSARLLSLVERMVPRLAADGGAELANHPGNADLDVVDLCLAAGLRINLGRRHSHAAFDVASWARDPGEGRRDLAAIAADPQWRPVLALGVRRAIGQLREGTALRSPALPVQTLRESFGAAGVRDVLVELIDELVGRTGAGTVTSLDADLSELAALWSPAGMSLSPEGFRRLPLIDLPAVLARSLRAGLPAELSWPQYEEALKGKLNPRTGTAWPELVVHDNRSAHVVAPDGRVTEHVFRLPAAGDRRAPASYSQTICLAADGDLLVAWSSPDGPVAYWSSRPGELLDGDWQASGGGWSWAAPLPVPGGGITTGFRPVHAGDVHGPSEACSVVSDGQAYWRCELGPDGAGGREWQWREFDPRTGDDGRYSMPAFFAAGTAAGGRIVPHGCELRPAPKEFAASPLGWQDGLVGWRVTHEPDGGRAGEGIDGRRVTVPPDRLSGEVLVGAVSLPGVAAPLPVTRLHGYPHARLRVWTAGCEYLLAELSEVGGILPPLSWWHALRPRDEAGSAALRTLDEATAAALLVIDDAVTGTTALSQAAVANVEAHLPAVTDPTLLGHVAGAVVRAVLLRRRMAEVPEILRAGPASLPALPEVSDEALRLAYDGLCVSDRTYYGGSPGPRHETLAQVAAVGAVLRAAGDDQPAIPAVGGGWTALLAGLGAVALRAASAATGEADRRALAAFLTTVAGTPLAGGGPQLRVLTVTQPEMPTDKVDVHRDGPQVTVLLPPEPQYHPVHGRMWVRSAVQAGAFTVPEGTTIRDEARPSGRLDGERLPAFAALLAERGPAPWRPEAVDGLAAATGMTRAEATLLLAGLPGIAAWEANFLTAEQRTALDLTAAHAKVARAALRELTPAQRVALLDAAMPADPARLWEHGPDVPAIADAWIRLRGRRIAVPEELVTELARVVDSSVAAAVLRAIASPEPGDWLSTDGRTAVRGYYGLRTVADAGVPFDGSYLQAAAVALPWLAYRLRWDDPLRAALPGALRLVRDRLRNPDLLVGARLIEVGSEPDAGPALVPGDGTNSYRSHHLAPAHLSGAGDPAIGFVDDETATAVRVVLSGWIEQALSTPEGASGDPHDPRVCVPHLVGEVGERFGCDTDAAAYYLQLLALPDPSDKAVQAWNGWKAADLRRARESLVAAGLVVAAKRERAGRSVFLPGGWQPAKPPRSPVETWKLPLYVEAGRLLLVRHPLPALFAVAWDRVTSGDVPRYRDLEETP